MYDNLIFQNITNYKGFLNYYIHIFAITVQRIKTTTTLMVAVKKVNEVGVT